MDLAIVPIVSADTLSPGSIPMCHAAELTKLIACAAESTEAAIEELSAVGCLTMPAEDVALAYINGLHEVTPCAEEADITPLGQIAVVGLPNMI